MEHQVSYAKAPEQTPGPNMVALVLSLQYQLAVLQTRLLARDRLIDQQQQAIRALLAMLEKRSARGR